MKQGESFAALKARAEYAEKRVAELERENAALRAGQKPFVEPLSQLVQVTDKDGKPLLGQWKYRDAEANDESV